MRLDDYLDLVLPPTGNYFVEWKTSGRRHASLSTPSIADASILIRQKHKAQLDVWIGIGSFGGTRKAEDCQLKKAFYADIDCGQSKDYPTIPAAIKAVIHAKNDGKIPPPTFILVSGNGIHVYWVLDNTIDRDEWSRLAARFRHAFRGAGLRVDPKVTCDAARILRPPETTNFKDRANPKPVYVDSHLVKLDRLYTPEQLMLLLPTLDPTLDQATAPAPAAPSGDTLASQVSIDDLTGGLQLGPFESASESERLRLAQDMLSRLSGPQYQKYDNWLKVGAALYDAATGSENQQDWMDLWDGWSQQSPQYDREELEDKWAKQFPGFSKVSIGTLVWMAREHGFCFPNAIHQVTYPPGYISTEFGTIREAREDEEHASFVMDSHLFDVDIRVQPERGYVFTAKSRHPATRRVLQLDTSTTSLNMGGARLAEEFGRAGIALKSAKQTQEVMTFMQSFMEQIAQARGVSDVVTSFGWVKCHGREGFAAGNNVYWEDGGESESVSAPPEIRRIYSPHGSLADWRAVAQAVLDQDRQEVNAVLAAAFAAPLMPMTQVSGMVLSLVGRDSGSGKSTALALSQSVWGEPKGGVFTLDDTSNSVVKRMETLQNLPAYWDEIRMQESIQNFIKMLFQLSQGKGKARLNSAAQLQTVGTWNTLLTVASNEPLQEYVDRIVSGTDAGTLRLLEMPITPVSPREKLPSYMYAFGKLGDNYGVAGAAYAKWLARNKPTADKLVRSAMAKFDATLNTAANERFWLATVSALYVGAHIATKMGLLQIDLGKLHEYLISLIKRSRGGAVTQTASAKATDLLNEFLSDTKANSIETESVHTRRGKPPTIDIHWPKSSNLVRHPLTYQKGRDNTLVVNLRKFREWLQHERNMSSKYTVDDLVAQGMRMSQKYTIGAGTSAGENTRYAVLIGKTDKAPLDAIF